MRQAGYSLVTFKYLFKINIRFPALEYMQKVTLIEESVNMISFYESKMYKLVFNTTTYQDENIYLRLGDVLMFTLLSAQNSNIV